MTRDTAFLAENLKIRFYLQEVSLVSFTLQLSSFTRKQFYRRLQQAYASGSLKLVKRIQALLALTQGQSVREVAAMLGLGEQTVRDYRTTGCEFSG
jgi:DNA-binding NarL/FixJ family response regulator